MSISMKPAESTDNPGEQMLGSMPLWYNIPDGLPGWVLTTCPLCPRECWSRPALEQEAKAIYGDRISFVCTECMMRAGRPE